MLGPNILIMREEGRGRKREEKGGKRDKKLGNDTEREGGKKGRNKRG